MSSVEVETHLLISLSVSQTPSRPQTEHRKLPQCLRINACPREFIFRDAKQFTGLSDCQYPHPQRLDFHFTARLIALTLAKYEVSNRHSSQASFVFSICSYK